SSLVILAQSSRREARNAQQLNQQREQEMTERARAEEARKNSDALYHSLVDNLPLNIFRKDAEGRFTFVNDRFTKLLGKAPDDILGKTDNDFFPCELAQKYRADDHRVLTTRQGYQTVEEH